MPHIVETQPATRASEPALSALAGKPAPKEMLIDVGRLVNEYYIREPDLSDPGGDRPRPLGREWCSG